MEKLNSFLACLVFFAGNLFAQQPKPIRDSTLFAGEKHFKNIQQLTFGGDNAEAYWSYDGKHIIFQRTNAKEGLNCDQIFIGKVPTKAGEKFTYKMVSSGKGRTTCAFFYLMGNIFSMLPLLKEQIVVRLFPTGLNMVINTSGHCMIATIFL